MRLSFYPEMGDVTVSMFYIYNVLIFLVLCFEGTFGFKIQKEVN
jgi:hypothetical protein